MLYNGSILSMAMKTPSQHPAKTNIKKRLNKSKFVASQGANYSQASRKQRLCLKEKKECKSMRRYESAFVGQIKLRFA